jgi:predicted HTH transcriptional regulator
MNCYPHAPGYKDSDTSRRAAEQIEVAAPRLREECLRALSGCPEGATADEIAAALDRSILSIRPRFSELRKVGKIRDTGQRRQNQSGCSAKVWRAA